MFKAVVTTLLAFAPSAFALSWDWTIDGGYGVYTDLDKYRAGTGPGFVVDFDTFGPLSPSPQTLDVYNATFSISGVDEHPVSAPGALSLVSAAKGTGEPNFSLSLQTDLGLTTFWLWGYGGLMDWSRSPFFWRDPAGPQSSVNDPGAGTQPWVHPEVSVRQNAVDPVVVPYTHGDPPGVPLLPEANPAWFIGPILALAAFFQFRRPRKA